VNRRTTAVSAVVTRPPIIVIPFGAVGAWARYFHDYRDVGCCGFVRNWCECYTHTYFTVGRECAVTMCVNCKHCVSFQTGATPGA
jgi:hypothetical protein